jgi:WhiB family redox-sensing transcriptional regulator
VTAVFIDETVLEQLEKAFRPATLAAAPAQRQESSIGAPVAIGAPLRAGAPIDTITPAHLRSDLPCQTGQADLWFSETPAGLEQAKIDCGPCPLREACLTGALERREPWGVWGGEIFERGVVISRKRPRGRPRKIAA